MIEKQFFKKLMYDLNAHVWWAQGEKRIKRKGGGGVPRHSEIILRKRSVVRLTLFLPSAKGGKNCTPPRRP